MARLPSRYDLSQPGNLRSGRAIASVDTSGLTRGLQSLGNDISSIGTDIRKDQSANEIIGADGPALKELHDFTRSFDADGDYGTFSKRAEDGINTIKAKYASKISNPQVRQQWEDDFGKRAETARNSIADLGERRVREGKLTDAKTGLQSYQSVIADDSVSQEDRDRAKTSASASIDALEHSGQISPSEAQTWRDTVVKGGDFILGQRETEKHGSDAISGKLPTRVADRAGMAMKFFQDKGWSKEQSAGIVGNLLAESSLDSGSRAAGDGSDGSDSIGIGQWNSDRANSLKQFARESGTDWRDFNMQLAFINEELNSSEKSAGNNLRSAKDVRAATEAMIMYERPQGSDKGAQNAHNYNGRLRFAQQAAGETVKPDWYLSQTPDKQLQLERNAQATDQKNAVAAAAQQKATAAQTVDDFQLRIQTDPTLTEQQILGDGRMDNGQKASLLSGLRTERKENAGTAELIAAIGAGKDVPINGFDADDRKIADKAYNKFVTAVPDEQQQQASAAFIKQTGYIPKDVQADLRNSAASTDQATFASSMVQAQRLSRLAPVAFNNFEGGDKVRDNLALFNSMTNERGLSSAQAAQEIMALNDPTRKLSREALKPQTTEFLKSLSVGEVTSAFDPAGLFNKPDAGLLPIQQNALLQEYKDRAEARFYETGDKSSARALALGDLKKVWGITNVSGGSQLMRMPPEKYYPPINNGHEYLRDDAMATAADWVKEQHPDRKVENVTLVPGVGNDGQWSTRADIDAGRMPRYRLFYTYQKDGQTLFDEVIDPRGPWGLSKQDVAGHQVKAQEGAGVKFSQRAELYGRANDALNAGDAAAEEAMKNTVGPDWMKARAAETAREKARMESTQILLHGERQMAQPPAASSTPADDSNADLQPTTWGAM